MAQVPSVEPGQITLQTLMNIRKYAEGINPGVSSRVTAADYESIVVSTVQHLSGLLLRRVSYTPPASLVKELSETVGSLSRACADLSSASPVVAKKSSQAQTKGSRKTTANPPPKKGGKAKSPSKSGSADQKSVAPAGGSGRQGPSSTKGLRDQVLRNALRAMRTWGPVLKYLGISEQEIRRSVADIPLKRLEGQDKSIPPLIRIGVITDDHIKRLEEEKGSWAQEVEDAEVLKHLEYRIQAAKGVWQRLNAPAPSSGEPAVTLRTGYLAPSWVPKTPYGNLHQNLKGLDEETRLASVSNPGASCSEAVEFPSTASARAGELTLPPTSKDQQHESALDEPPSAHSKHAYATVDNSMPGSCGAKARVGELTLPPTSKDQQHQSALRRTTYCMNNCLTPQQQLLLALHNGSFLTVAGNFAGVSKSTASKTVRRLKSQVTERKWSDEDEEASDSAPDDFLKLIQEYVAREASIVEKNVPMGGDKVKISKAFEIPNEIVYTQTHCYEITLKGKNEVVKMEYIGEGKVEANMLFENS
ncbi:unnamed protein product [Acanthoscelides obtectus]|uniref:Uncharacterized protein n=1 Tax=Acanthoscelides obtectus TaxID=200917 RepID=A0A9P0KXW5_ACAOB|nr:unnamed protein product [Acanthoscelides obtectus]CAK1674579.1 hypothetical protein AOBTE_LOCUS29669 [Acanthoscelides obtectus]